MKRLPLIAPLRQSVGDNEHGLGINSHAGVTAQDFDIFDPVMIAALQAGAPMADAVKFAVDRGCRNRRRLLQFPVFAQELLPLGLMVRVEHFVEIRDLGSSALRVIKRAGQSDDLSHRVGQTLGQLARVDSTEALAYDTYATIIFLMALTCPE